MEESNSRKKFRRRVGIVILSIILIISGSLGYFYYLYTIEKSRPEIIIYFEETFPAKNIDRWKLIDANLASFDEATSHYMVLARDNYFAPHMKTVFDYKKSPPESFVWTFSIKTKHYTGDAIVLGTLVFPLMETSIVMNKEGKLGLSRNMFADAIYSESSFSKVASNEWVTISVFFDVENDLVKVFCNHNEVLETSLIEQIFPIHEIWLGSVWIGGKENYGVALDVHYDDIIIANEGIVPVPSFWEFLRKIVITLY